VSDEPNADDATRERAQLLEQLLGPVSEERALALLPFIKELAEGIDGLWTVELEGSPSALVFFDTDDEWP